MARLIPTKHIKCEYYFFLIFLLSSFLISCASSGVQREAAENVDLGVQNAKNLIYASGGNLADTYQNSSQRTKGLLFGAGIGALTGSLTYIGLVPGLVVGTIYGGAYGAYIDSTTDRTDRLENRNVEIIVLGDQVRMIVGSERIFDEMTAVIKPQAFSTLNMMVAFLNRFIKMNVKVAAFTDDSGNCAVDLALSQQQANAIMRYFQLAGLDARLLYARGYGSSQLVTRTNTGWDSDNYRIEITLEKLYIG